MEYNVNLMPEELFYIYSSLVYFKTYADFESTDLIDEEKLSQLIYRACEIMIDVILEYEKKENNS